MVTDTVRASLTKQGYRVIGSHSGRHLSAAAAASLATDAGVKLCRWTKAMLRGRGGCYKHTFYGIASYQCMEVPRCIASRRR